MRWRALKSIPLSGVEKRLNEFRETYGSLSYLHDMFTKGRMPTGIFQDYVEWTNMDHAFRAYQEGEDFEYLSEIDLELSSDDYKKLTPKRIELLDHLMEGRVNSINELAKNVDRNVKNVYNDLKALESLGMVALLKEGRNTVPDLLVYEITLLLG
jgi:predicted transcriptional regulator